MYIVHTLATRLSTAKVNNNLAAKLWCNLLDIQVAVFFPSLSQYADGSSIRLHMTYSSALRTGKSLISVNM